MNIKNKIKNWIILEVRSKYSYVLLMVVYNDPQSQWVKTGEFG